MRSGGDLYVFEGPDSVGKTELSRRFSLFLRDKGIPTELLSFPGKKDGTLGKLVYDLHHDPNRFGLAKIAASSLQLLHIAAHLDVIEHTILPALRTGKTVVLDRFWWSTKVYGLSNGVARKTLEAMIAVELSAWGPVKPKRIFLIRRDSPLRPEPQREWEKWRDLYETIAVEQGRSCPVQFIDNNGEIEKTIAHLEAAVEQIRGDNEETGSQRALEFQPSGERQNAPHIFTALSPAKPTVVYETYWRFAAERQRIFFKRMMGLPPPWTEDPILRDFKFTNAYRASDRVSQYLIRNVIYKGEQTEEEIFFRTILFKLFNKIETWELLISSFGPVTYREFDFRACDDVLVKAIARGERIYSAAYIMPSGSTVFSTTRKHRAHIKLLEQMMHDEVPLRFAESRTMFEAFHLLRSYPMIGDFLAYQYVTDLNYSTLTDFSEMEFVVPGPGAKGGISKCFESLGGLTETDIIRVVAERQEEERQVLKMPFRLLWGRRLQLIDCQSLFCEVDKYARVQHPEFAGNSRRTRIKQKFRPNLDRIEYWYPPKWGINEEIERQREEKKH